MTKANFFTTPDQLWNLIGTPSAPQIIDVRRRDIFEATPGKIPASTWREIGDVSSWKNALDPNRAIVVACKAGHELSQSAAAQMRADGIDATVLEGGYVGWTAAGLPLVDKTKLPASGASLWVTRRRPKIDRIACPWLIRRFLDADARILFVDPPDVAATARETGATPFDIDGVEFSHEGERCSFDTMLNRFELESEPSLARLALIVRGADTARPDLAPEAAGLHAISLGLSALAEDDDHALLESGFQLYDGLFAWLRHASEERHNWPVKASS